MFGIEPVPVKSSVFPSGLCSTESEGNPGKIFAALGFLDGIEFPGSYAIEFPGSTYNHGQK